MNKDTKFVKAAVVLFVIELCFLIVGAVGGCEVGYIEPLSMLIQSLLYMALIHAAVKLYSYCNYVERKRKKKRSYSNGGNQST